jgi:hypothetical protein
VISLNEPSSLSSSPHQRENEGVALPPATQEREPSATQEREPDSQTSASSSWTPVLRRPPRHSPRLQQAPLSSSRPTRNRRPPNRLGYDGTQGLGYLTQYDSSPATSPVPDLEPPSYKSMQTFLLSVHSPNPVPAALKARVVKDPDTLSFQDAMSPANRDQWMAAAQSDRHPILSRRHEFCQQGPMDGSGTIGNFGPGEQGYLERSANVGRLELSFNYRDVTLSIHQHPMRYRFRRQPSCPLLFQPKAVSRNCSQVR